MIEQKQLPTAEPQLDLETIRKRYYEAQTEIAALTAMVATYDAELERVRALPSKWREDGEKEEGDGEMGAAIACWCCANELEAALASPAAEPATDTDVGTKMQQLDIEGVLPDNKSGLEWLTLPCSEGVNDG